MNTEQRVAVLVGNYQLLSYAFISFLIMQVFVEYKYTDKNSLVMWLLRVWMPAMIM